ncbi:MAG: PKD domain-containing protein [Thermoplasmata archaeon]|nr:PKD domain-containing protein [Thermoplasmata archaeon]
MGESKASPSAARRTRVRTGLTVFLVGMLLFSAYGSLTPSNLRCALPGRVDCAGGLLGPTVAPVNASFTQWFNVTMPDYSFWIINTVTGANESNAWYLFEGWTVHINATSWPNNPALGGTAYHGLGVEINATGTQLLDLAAPTGVWVTGSFVAPTARYSDQYIWCTVQCGPGHGGQHENNVFVVPSTMVPTVTLAANRTTGNPPLAVSFNASVTGGTAPFTESWAFGDGNSTSGTLTTSHTFAVQGNYQTTVTLTDSKGFTSSRSLWIDVGASAPITVKVVGNPSSGAAPMVTQLNSTVKGGAPPYTYAWTFGDGGGATGSSPTHVYGAPGVYAAIVTVRDVLGHSGVGWASIAAHAAAGRLTVTVALNPSTGTAPFATTFTVTISGGTAPYQTQWLFGDGTVGSGSPANHVYNTTGLYEVVALASDSIGNTGFSVTAVTVGGAAGAALSGQLELLPNAGSAPLTVNASISMSGGTGTYSNTTWTWGDGTSATGRVLSHTFSAAGTYSVSAAIADTGGGGGGGGDDVAATIYSTVHVEGLSLQIALNRTMADAPAMVGAIASIVSGSGVYNTVTWNWGDGMSSTGVAVNHTYAPSVSGPVQVQATVQDSAGAQATASANVTLSPQLSGRLAILIPRLTGFPIPVNLTLTLVGGTGNYSKTSLWNFGDTGSVRGANVQTHVYLKSGRYQVAVQANDSSGSAVTVTGWVNFTKGGSGTTHPPPTWVFNGLPDPDAVAIALMGIIAFAGLLLLYRSRARAAKKTSPAIRKAPAKDARSSSPGADGREP